MDPSHTISSSTSYEDFQRCLAYLDHPETSVASENLQPDSPPSSATGSEFAQLSAAPRNRPRQLNAVAHLMNPHILGSVMHQVGSPPPAQTIPVQAPETSASEPSTDTLYLALMELGFYSRNMVVNETIEERLRRTECTVAALLEAVNIAKDLAHPLMQVLHANSEDRFNVLNGISRLFDRRGLTRGLERVIAESNNNPYQLVANIKKFKP